MQEYNPGEVQPGALVRTYNASAAVTAGTFVEITPATKKVTAYTGAAAPAGKIGVVLDTAAAGKDVRVCIAGEVSVSTDTTGVMEGAWISAETNGKAETAASNDYILGYALTSGTSVALIELACAYTKKE